MADVVGESDDGQGAGARTPPYVSFSTFMTFLKGLKADGVPPQIDRSVLSKLSGGVQGQMKMALRSLGLMEGDRPTSNLQRLVEAMDTDDFARVLLERLQATYPYAFALDLTNATPTMLADAFKVTGAREDVLRKCRTFFLHAARQVGVAIGPRILNGSVPRSPSVGQRRKPKVRVQESKTAAPISPPPISAEISDKALEYKLVDLLKEPTVGDPEREAIWVLIKYLTAKAKAVGT